MQIDTTAATAEQQGEQPVLEESAPVSADESTKMMGILMHIQELFYSISSHKDGPNAGKVNKD